MPWVTYHQIGKHKKFATDTRVYAKIGQLCELDPGHVSNQIKSDNHKNVQQNSVSVNSQPEFREIIVTKFREMWGNKFEFRINFVFFEIKKIDFHIHPSYICASS
jgi:hypothetical protein